MRKTHWTEKKKSGTLCLTYKRAYKSPHSSAQLCVSAKRGNWLKTKPKPHTNSVSSSHL